MVVHVCVCLFVFGNSQISSQITDAKIPPRLVTCYFVVTHAFADNYIIIRRSGVSSFTHAILLIAHDVALIPASIHCPLVPSGCIDVMSCHVCVWGWYYSEYAIHIYTASQRKYIIDHPSSMTALHN